MTPEELDIELRTITAHEKLYRMGINPDSMNGSHYVNQVDGVFVSPSGLMRPSPSEGRSVYAKSLRSHIFVRKHSRFRSNKIHRQDAVELAYVYSGRASKIVNGTRIDLQQGQVIIVDSHTAHNTLPLVEEDIFIIMQFDKRLFEGGFITMLGEDSILSSFIINSIITGASHDGYLVFHSENNRRLHVFMTEFLCEHFDPSPRNDEMSARLLAVISEELACVREDDVTSSYETHRTIVPNILRFIEREYRTCTVKQAADVFSLAPDSLSRILKRETGSTFNQLVQQQRINVAKSLLAEGSLPVTGVARQVGYENMTHFYKLFQKAVGTSPSNYKKHMLETQQSANDFI